MINGTVGNYLKSMQLQQKWKMKQQGVTLNDDDLKLQAANARKEYKLQSITNKLKSGMRLSGTELEYLRTNSPQLYEKAVRVEKERTEFRKELDHCKSQEDAEKVYTQKLQQFAAECKSIEQSSMSRGDKIAAMDFLQMRMSAIEKEYESFRKGSRLPKEDEIKPKKSTQQEEQDEAIRLLKKKPQTEGSEETTPPTPQEMEQSFFQVMQSPEEILWAHGTGLNPAQVLSQDASDTQTHSANVIPLSFSKKA